MLQSFKLAIKSIIANKEFIDLANKKYNLSNSGLNIKMYELDEKLRRKIKNNYNLIIHEGKQGKHIRNHNNYSGKSYILDTTNPQDLVDKFAGTGDIKRIQTTGKWINKQFFMNDVPIGYVIDEETKKEILTRRFAIHYSKDKGTHIVPILEKR